MLVAGTVVLASPLVYLLGRMLMRARARGRLRSPRLLLGLKRYGKADDREGAAQEDEQEVDEEEEEEEVGVVPTPAVHSWGASARQGKRTYMEDRHVIEPTLPVVAAAGPKDADSLGVGGRVAQRATATAQQSPFRGTLFAVFDGHGGSYTAEFASKRFSSLLQCELGWQLPASPQVPEPEVVVPAPMPTDAASPQPSPPSPTADVGGTGSSEIVCDTPDHVAAGSGEGKCCGGPSLVDARLVAAFERLDAEFVSEHPTRSRTGSTALVVLLVDCAKCGTVPRLHVAHAGDSRAVMCRGGRAVRLTEDHSASAPLERARVCAAGGMVCNDPNEGPGALPRVFTTTGKGGLAVTRALGDAFLKNVPGRAPVAASSLVLATPEVSHLDLCLPGAVGGRCGADSADVVQFVVLASDGLWDVFTDQGAVAWVARALRTHCGMEGEVGGKEEGEGAWVAPPRKPSPCNAAAAEAAAASLVDEAYNRGSADNITAVVVLFGGCHPAAAAAAAPPTRAPSSNTKDVGSILRRSSTSRKAIS